VLQDFKDETGMWKAVWSSDPLSGDLAVLDASLTTPNGLTVRHLSVPPRASLTREPAQLSPDAKTLYVCVRRLHQLCAGN
jgi:hypothetical protein